MNSTEKKKQLRLGLRRRRETAAPNKIKKKTDLDWIHGATACDQENLSPGTKPRAAEKSAIDTGGGLEKENSPEFDGGCRDEKPELAANETTTNDHGLAVHQTNHASPKQIEKVQIHRNQNSDDFNR
jgi:hypothetical protein